MGIKIKATGGSKLNDSPDPIENFFVVLPVLSIMFQYFAIVFSFLSFCFLWLLFYHTGMLSFQRREQRKQQQLSNPHYLKMSAREEHKVSAS